MKLIHAILSVALLSIFSHGALADSPVCNAAANETKVSWPDATNPIWEMCWLTPQRSSGPRGSGLEIRNVHYRGVLILKRAHSPMLFADYRNGGGGNCYRDWKDANSGFAAEASVRNQLGTPTIFAKTNCDVSTNATTAYGNCPFTNNPVLAIPAGMCFTAGGVAIENLPNNAGMLLTTQYTAGWYKYSSRFYFFTNGDFDAEMGFGNSDGTFNGTTHWHQNYWRLDFDLAGAGNDVFSVDSQAQTTEWSGLRNSSTFRVFDSTAGFGYEIDYSQLQGDPGNESGRNFHQVDILATSYKPTEFGDNPVYSLGDCRMRQEALANGESLSEDMVLYYRGGSRDATFNDWPTSGAAAIPQDSMVCKVVRPKFRFVGQISSDPPVFANGFE